MSRLAILLVMALAIPAAGQEAGKPKRPAAKSAMAKPVGQRAAHSKPTAQQIRKFDELEKKEEKGRAPSPK